VAVETLSKALNNIIMNPTEEKYRYLCAHLRNVGVLKGVSSENKGLVC